MAMPPVQASEGREGDGRMHIRLVRFTCPDAENRIAIPADSQ